MNRHMHKSETWRYERKLYDFDNEVGISHESEIVVEVEVQSTYRPAEPEIGETAWADAKIISLTPVSIRPCLPDVTYDQSPQIMMKELTESQAEKVKELCERNKEELMDGFLDEYKYQDAPSGSWRT